MKPNEMQNEVEKTLGSLEGLQKAEPGDFFYDKVMNRLQHTEAKVISIKPRLLWQAAACFAALVALNIFVWSQDAAPETQQDQTQEQTQTTNPLAQEYFSYLNNSQF